MGGGGCLFLFVFFVVIDITIDINVTISIRISISLCPHQIVTILSHITAMPYYSILIPPFRLVIIIIV